jgi:hypothetical protein
VASTGYRRLVPTIVGLVLLGAACGSGGSKATTAATSTTPTTRARGAAAAAFRQCMASHGVTIPQRTRPSTPGTTEPSGTANDGAGGGGFGGGGGGSGFGGLTTAPPGVDQATFQAALNACRSLVPTGGGGAQFQAAFTAYLNCLKSHGIQVDPSQGRRALSGLDQTSSAFQAANQICRQLLPTRSGASSTTSPSTSVPA